MCVTAHLLQPTRAAFRKTRTARRKPCLPPLFGLAPGGVCRAVHVTVAAVRSYRTLSPLPRSRKTGAVCFLWHFPWSRLRRTLSGTVFPWSPDFPHRCRKPGTGAVIQPAGVMADHISCNGLPMPTLSDQPKLTDTRSSVTCRKGKSAPNRLLPCKQRNRKVLQVTQDVAVCEQAKPKNNQTSTQLVIKSHDPLYSSRRRSDL